MKQVSYSGILDRGGPIRLGGEGTGWTLKIKDEDDIEVEMQLIKEPEQFVRKRVTVTGYFFTQTFIENPPAEALMAETIQVIAPPKKKPPPER